MDLTQLLHNAIYFLNVTERSEIALDLLHESEGDFHISTVKLGPRVVIILGFLESTFLFSDWRIIALDVYSRTLFLLPGPNAEWETVGDQVGLVCAFLFI